MKKALISPIEPRETGYRVAQVEDQPFDVAPPFFWVDCDDNVMADYFWYNPENGSFVQIVEEPVTPTPAPIDGAPQPISQGAQTL